MSEADVKTYYDSLIHERDRTDIMRRRCHAVEITSRIDTVITVLDLLDKKIGGINDHEQS